MFSLDWFGTSSVSTFRQDSQAVVYIPNSRFYGKQLVSTIVCALGVVHLLGGVIAASMCLTLVPSLALFALSALLFAVAYKQYTLGWDAVEISAELTSQALVTDSVLSSLRSEDEFFSADEGISQ